MTTAVTHRNPATGKSMCSPDVGKVNHHSCQRDWHLASEAEVDGAPVGWQSNDDSAQLLDGRRLSLTV